MSTTSTVWVDNGSASWPPQDWWGLDAADWPETFEVWEKYRDEAECRRISQRRDALRCTTWIPAQPVRRSGQVSGAIKIPGRVCGASLASWREAPRHQAQHHPGQGCSFEPFYVRWTWELLGFADLFEGNPIGYFNVGNGADSQTGLGRLMPYCWVVGSPILCGPVPTLNAD